MIFGPPPNLGLPSPHYEWFKEAIENYWWTWSLPETGEAPYGLQGPSYPFNTFLGAASVLATPSARVWVSPGSDNSVSMVPDQHGLLAFLNITLAEDKRLFCETAVILALDIAVYLLVDDPRFAVASSADLCEMFGRPSTAWGTEVRGAVIELLKELGAHPDLVKYRNRSPIKLQISPPSLRVGRVWVPSGRAKRVEDFDPSEVGPPPEDNPPLFSVKQPVAHDGLLYDTIPADAASSLVPGLFFHEVTPPEWPELLRQFSSPYEGVLGSASKPRVSTITSPPPPQPFGAIAFTGLVDSTAPSGGQTRRLVYEGEFNGGGDWTLGIIPWGDGHGYRADLDTSTDLAPWGQVSTHILLVYDLAFPLAPPIARVIDGYVLDWARVDIVVYDADDVAVYVGGGNKGTPADGGTLGLTDIQVKGSSATEIGMFEAIRLPLTRVTVRVTSTNIAVYNEDDLHVSPGGGASWTLDHYVFPDSLMPGSPPPWPGGVRQPGNIAVGPGLSGSHPTVKGLRGGRVVGR
jgi:hypothetical protein